MIALNLGATPALTMSDPVAINGRKLQEHLREGQLKIRSSGAEKEIHTDIPLEIVVDEQGRVRSARAADSYRDLSRRERRGDWLLSAISAARKWRFDPFIVGGKAVAVRGEAEVVVLPAERWQSRRVPFPDGPPETTTIKLERTGCYGSCPAYSITVRGDGRVEYDGKADVLVTGHHTYAVTRERVEALIRQFRDTEFWRLHSEYESSVTDSSTRILTVTVGSESKEVLDYVGAYAGMPDVVTELQKAVDEVADSASMVVGNERTIARLEAEGFDFRSSDATLTFLRSIQSAPEATALSFMNHGVPLDVTVPASAYQSAEKKADRIALESAVRRGHVEVFKWLNQPALFASLAPVDLNLLLMSAARVKSPHIVRTLIARGADSRARHRQLGSPLIQALHQNYFDPASDADQEAVFGMLLETGSDLEVTDSIGWTALQHSYDDDPKFARMLLEAGANVNARTGDDQSLLYLTDDEEIALLALEAGADRTLKDYYGFTLHEIAKRKGWNRVRALLASPQYSKTRR